MTYPALNVLIARWAPPDEKSKFLAAMMGNTLGVVFAFSFSGVVTDAFGWPWSFYGQAIIMVVYVIIFWLIVSDSPTKHKWISEEEKTYILTCQEGKVSSVKV